MRIAGFLAAPLICASFASAQVETGPSPSFDHDALNCMSTEEFPVVEAVSDAAESSSLRKAQVYFKASRTDAWYFVDMERQEETRLRAFLPKPLAETDRVHYYLFFLSGSFATSQSEEYSVQVSETGCGAIPGAGTMPPGSLTLHATVANQTPVPPGFQPHGISGLVTTAGTTVPVGSSGGLSGVAVGVAAGAGAVAAGVVLAGGGDGSGAPGSSEAGQPPGGGAAPTSSTGSSPSPTGSPSPSPGQSVPDVSGTWHVTDRIVDSCVPSHVGQTSETTMVIQQSGSLLTASLSGQDFSGNLAGTIDAAGKISMAGQFVDDRDAGEVRVEASTTSGTDMTGSYTQFYPQHGCTVRGAFSGSKR